MKKKIIIIGGGFHSNSILDIISRTKNAPKILGYLDPKKTKLKIKYLGNDSILSKYNSKKIILVNGIGTNINLRKKIFEKFEKKYKFHKIIDKSAIISKNAVIESGAVIFPLTHIGPNVHIGKNVVVHTKASIEHDSIIDDHSYLGPNCTVCGNTKVGESVLVGGSSFLKENIVIKDKIKISAGSVVLKSFNKKNILIYGSPAEAKR